MYAKIAMTTWDHKSPTRSILEGCDRSFDHEMSCARYERMDQDCNCYVSRIRLVKTPVGEFIPTTEPDLRESLAEAKIAIGLTIAAIIAVTVIQAIVLAVGA